MCACVCTAYGVSMVCTHVYGCVCVHTHVYVVCACLYSACVTCVRVCTHLACVVHGVRVCECEWCAYAACLWARAQGLFGGVYVHVCVCVRTWYA